MESVTKTEGAPEQDEQAKKAAQEKKAKSDKRRQAHIAQGLTELEVALRLKVGFVRPEPLCLVLGIKRMTLHRWIKRRVFPAPVLLGTSNKVGQPIGFPAAAVAEWIAARPVANVKPVPRKKALDHAPQAAA